MSHPLPPVAPSVTAELVDALPPRLRKRLDAGVAKLAARPVTVDGEGVRIAVDATTELRMRAPGGMVGEAEGIRCGCLLSPACLHRAAAACAAPVAVVETADPDTSGTGTAAAAITGAEAAGAEAAGAESAGAKAPGAGPADARGAGAAVPGGGGGRAPDTPTPTAATATDTATEDQRGAADAVFRAAAAVLETGTDGAGAVAQAELLRAAHAARLAGLPRAAAAAVSVVTRLREARSADPAYRLSDLSDRLREALFVAHRVPVAAGEELARLRGAARRPYAPDGSLRLYGLFSEPVLTASGYAGAVTWAADAGGRLFSVSDVAPGGPGRAAGAAGRAVRLGDTALTHRELSRAGLAVSGATVSEDGRLGAGAGVRAVRASGAAWDAEPLGALWAVPVGEQVARALDGRERGDGLLFLDVTLLGAVREAAGVCLVADCDGVRVRLTAAHDHPGLAYRDNVALLASAAGLRLRAVARLEAAPAPRARLLAAGHPSDPSARVGLGFERLQRADLPAGAAGGAAGAAGLPGTPSSPCPPGLGNSPGFPGAPGAAGGEPPVHLLRRRVHQAASAGRRVLALPEGAGTDAARLRRHGLGTAADLVGHLHSAARARGRDPFGRLLAADPRVFARAWLAAAVCADETDRALCAAAWGASPPPPGAAAP
ncbi:hypothetical protein [Streptomyces fradiae]|uniref:hypothetical protein n=1 Tax=Streptomyces fradiae TaxID=1906 RepID=UPI0039867A48